MTLCAGDDRATVSTSGRSTPSRCPNKCATRSAGDGRPSMGRSMRSAAKGAASWPVGTKGLVKERHPAGAIPLRIEGVERNGCDRPCFRHVVFRQGMMRIYSVRPCLKGGGQALHPRAEVARQTCQIRQAAIQAKQSDRDHVRTPERLASGCHPLRQIPDGSFHQSRSQQASCSGYTSMMSGA